MSDIKSALVQYNNAMDVLEMAEKAVQEALLHIKTAANASTVEVEGQFFQVRERKDKLYLCELSGKPRGRPKGSKNTKPRKGSRVVGAVDAGDDGEAVVPRLVDVVDVVDVLDEPAQVTGVRDVSEGLDVASA